LSFFEWAIAAAMKPQTSQMTMKVVMSYPGFYCNKNLRRFSIAA